MSIGLFIVVSESGVRGQFAGTGFLCCVDTGGGRGGGSSGSKGGGGASAHSHPVSPPSISPPPPLQMHLFSESELRGL